MFVAITVNPFIFPLLVFDTIMGVLYMLEISRYQRQEEAVHMFASQPTYPNNGVIPPQFAYPPAAPIPSVQQAGQTPYPYPPTTPDVHPNQKRTQ